MKRIFSAIILAAALFTSCSKEGDFIPGISFLTPRPEILEETAIFRLIGQPFTSADSVKIPVTFGGTAVMGTDYEASADFFTLRADSPADSIVISTKQLGTERTVNLSFQIPEGFTAGKYTTSEFTLQNKFGMLSFTSQKGYIADTTEYNVVLIDSRGNTKALSKDCPIKFSVNTEKSTAVEGVNFEFIGDSQLSIISGTALAGFKIAPIGERPTAGKDKIVFNVQADEKFDIGPYPEMELNMLEARLNVLDGRWMMDSLVTDSLYFEKIWADQCSGYRFVPGYSAFDIFEISFANALFAPSFESLLQNYFIGKSNLDFGKEIDMVDPLGQSKKVLLLSLDKTNRYFAADTTSADTVSYVGVYLTKNEETQLDMMEMYILDHTSMSFMPELKENNKYGTEKPVATTTGTYLQAIFRKR